MREEETTYHELRDVPIDRAEIREAFLKSCPGKAAWIDSVPGRCLKEAQNQLMPFLYKTFNPLYNNHYFPRKSIVVPLHKKGDFQNPHHYRGISLLCTSCKLFTSVLANRLRAWMDNESKICLEQARSQANHSNHGFTWSKNSYTAIKEESYMHIL